MSLILTYLASEVSFYVLSSTILAEITVFYAAEAIRD